MIPLLTSDKLEDIDIEKVERIIDILVIEFSLKG